MHNVGEARIQGAELEGRWRLARDWTVFATLAGLDGRDLSTDQYLPDIAPVSGRAGVTWQRAGFWGRVQARWALDQNHTPDEVEGTDGYATLDAALRYRLPWAGMDHQVTLSLDNILNRQYQNYLANSRGIELYEAGFSAALMYTVDF
jgi:hemoglobin/transferrin/lactoferrin receptor protein